MIPDKVIGAYISQLRHQIDQLSNDIAHANFTDLYSVGKLQGRVIGLEQAKQLLDNVLEELD